MTSYQKPLSVEQAEVLALEALAAMLGNERIAARLLALTGLDVETLRARAGTPEILCAVLDFLMANEGDLLTCASQISRNPVEFVAARQVLEA
jgi:hypothetical protein